MILNKKPVFQLLICTCSFLLLSGCNSNHEVEEERPEPEALDLTFEEELVITGDESIPTSLLTEPLVVKSDSEGYIYITDRNFYGIKVYRPDGSYFGNIGREGQGPGEFSRVPAFVINTNNEILTYSSFNGALFSRSGELMNTFLVDSNRLGLPGSYYLTLPDGRHIINRNFRGQTAAAEGMSDSDLQIRQHNLHVVSSDLNSVLESFVNPDTMISVNEVVTNTYMDVHESRMWVTVDGDIWYVPAIYEGRLYKYSETETGWQLEESMDGYLYPDESVDFDSDFENSPNSWGVVTYNGLEGESYIGNFNSVSIGAFSLNNGRLVHFSNQLLDEEMKTVVELFDEEREIVGTGVIEDFVIPATRGNSQRYPIWKDQDDRFYLVDESGIEPVIRIGLYTEF